MDRSAARRVLAATLVLGVGEIGDDAIPVLVRALPQLPQPYRAQTQAILDAREIELTSDPTWTSPAAWNLSRQRAAEALATLP